MIVSFYDPYQLSSHKPIYKQVTYNKIHSCLTGLKGCIIMFCCLQNRLQLRLQVKDNAWDVYM